MKTIETRAQDTNHRGWFAIHATKHWPDEYRELLTVFPFVDCLFKINETRVQEGRPPIFRPELMSPFTNITTPQLATEIGGELPRGAIVGVAYLAKVERTDGILERWHRREDVWNLTDPDYNDVPCWEPSFGDYTPGRKAYWLARPMPLITPIPADGFPGWWDTKMRTAGDLTVYSPAAVDPIERAIVEDLDRQGKRMTDPLGDASFHRLVQRRGETLATSPRNM